MKMNTFFIYIQEQCVPRFLLFSVKERRSVLARGHVYPFDPKRGACCRVLCCVTAVTSKMVREEPWWFRVRTFPRVTSLTLSPLSVAAQPSKFWRTAAAIYRFSCACNFICVLSLFSRGRKKITAEARVFLLEWPRVPVKRRECKAALMLHPVRVRNCLSHT